MKGIFTLSLRTAPVTGVILLLLLVSGCTSNQPQTSPTVQSLQPVNSPSPPNVSGLPPANANTNSPPLPVLPASTVGAPQPPAQAPSHPSSTELAVVKSVRANLREQPNQSSPVIEEVRQGDALKLVSRSPVGPWYRVRHDETGTEGWIHGNGIVITNPTAGTAARTPQPRIEEGGTATAPNTNKAETTSGRSYINVDGQRVPSPVFSSTAPAGASARCRDGSYSFSQHRRGTCSHHGGVAEWLRNDIP